MWKEKTIVNTQVKYTEMFNQKEHREKSQGTWTCVHILLLHRCLTLDKAFDFPSFNFTSGNDFPKTMKYLSTKYVHLNTSAIFWFPQTIHYPSLLSTQISNTSSLHPISLRKQQSEQNIHKLPTHISLSACICTHILWLLSYYSERYKSKIRPTTPFVHWILNPWSILKGYGPATILFSPVSHISPSSWIIPINKLFLMF